MLSKLVVCYNTKCPVCNGGITWQVRAGKLAAKLESI